MKSKAESETKAKKYNARSYSFPEDFLIEVKNLKSHVAYFQIFLIWMWIYTLSQIGKMLFVSESFWLIYPLLALLIAGRQGALFQIVHEASHSLISPDKFMNYLVGNYVAALPLGLTLAGYTKSHAKHHAGTNTSKDLPTDMEKYSITDIKNFKFYLKFINDIFGITAFRSFFGHNVENSIGRHSIKTFVKDNYAKFISLGITQCFLIAVIFEMDFVLYLLLWVFPLVSINMVLMRVRGIAEHGAPMQFNIKIDSPNEGNYYTRSVVIKDATLVRQIIFTIERILIGSLNTNYHHEHHLLPRVPFYNLKKVHDYIKKDEFELNSLIYVDGYFSSLLAGVRREKD